MKPKLSPAVEERIAQIARADLATMFRKFALSTGLHSEDLNDLFLHPTNRDAYLRGFGEWLARYQPEVASNE